MDKASNQNIDFFRKIEEAPPNSQKLRVIKKKKTY